MGSRRGVANAIIPAIALILAGCLRPTLSAPPEKYTIFLETMGVTLELPKGYAAFQREDKGPPYFTNIDFGKEFGVGHLKYAGLEIGFSPTAHDSSGDYVPSKYVDTTFEWAKGIFQRRVPGWKQGPEYITLFGNKAVRYSFTSGDTEYMFILGYLRGDQLPPKSAAHKHPEYHVRIVNVVAEGQFVKPDKLLDTVINSLRVIR
jgi:hypothetical protein